MPALIGAFRATLSADTAKFEAGMKRAHRSTVTATSGINKSLGILKSGLVGLAAGLSIGLFVRGIKGALDYAGSLAEVAQQLGVTTRDLQVFRFAAGQVGVSQQQLETGLSKLTITLGKLALGAEAPRKAFEAVKKGLSDQLLAASSTGEAFRILADALQPVASRSQRAAVEITAMGKSGSMLDNLLSGGSAAINELALAAEKLGIVLSDEQIQKADETADKLAALKTILSAQIAGVVANNADAILGLANALVKLVSTISTALNAWRQFQAEFNSSVFSAMGNDAAATLARGSNFKSGDVEVKGKKIKFIGGTGQPSIPGRSVTVKLPPAKALAPQPGTSIGQFLAGGGGGKKGKTPKADHSAEDALRDAHQFDQDIRRAQMDVLSATQDLASDYVERAIIAIQLLDLEKATQDAELQFQVALNKLTKGKEGLSEVQAAQLKLEFDKKDALERQKVLEDEQTQRRAEYNELERTIMEVGIDQLQSEEQLAETASEQRAIRLRILDAQYAMERAVLETVIADEKSSELAKNQARQRLAALDKMQSNDRQGVLNSTRGPLGDHLASLPGTAEKWNEALENVAANGLQSLEDGLVGILSGTKSVGQAFHEMAQSIIADLLRIYVQKIIIQAVGGSLGGGFQSGGFTGFALGGFTGMGHINRIAGVVHKQEFVLNAEATRRLGVPNLNALNRGAPMSAVSNDNGSIGTGGPVHIHMSGPMSDRQARQTGMQAAAAFKQEIARSSKAGY